MGENLHEPSVVNIQNTSETQPNSKKNINDLVKWANDLKGTSSQRTRKGPPGFRYPVAPITTVTCHLILNGMMAKDPRKPKLAKRLRREAAC